MLYVTLSHVRHPNVKDIFAAKKGAKIAHDEQMQCLSPSIYILKVSSSVLNTTKEANIQVGKKTEGLNC